MLKLKAAWLGAVRSRKHLVRSLSLWPILVGPADSLGSHQEHHLITLWHRAPRSKSRRRSCWAYRRTYCADRSKFENYIETEVAGWGGLVGRLDYYLHCSLSCPLPSLECLFNVLDHASTFHGVELYSCPRWYWKGYMVYPFERSHYLLPRRSLTVSLRVSEAHIFSDFISWRSFTQLSCQLPKSPFSFSIYVSSLAGSFVE